MPDFPNKIVRVILPPVFLSAHGYVLRLPQPIRLETKITIIIVATAGNTIIELYLLFTLFSQHCYKLSIFYFTEELTLSGKLRTPQGHRDDDGNDVRFESQLWLASKSILFMMTHCFKSLNSQHPA